MINIVLYNPEIPQNTGNIMRTAAGFNAKLHLIKPLGFSLDTKYVKRSTANYFELCDYYVYDDFEDFTAKNKGAYFFVTRYGQKSPDEFNYDIEEDVYLIFGSESSGMPYELLSTHLDTCMRIPMNEKVRSLNLSNTVALVTYEAVKQINYKGLSLFEPEDLKGKDYLKRK